MILVIILAVAAVALITVLAVTSIQIIPQARAANVEWLGQYRRTLRPGLNFIVPFLERVKPHIDLRETVVTFEDQPVITEDNLMVHIDTVLFFQVTDPRAADYEIVDYAQAIEQLSATMLRSVIGTMDLEQTLTSRDRINSMLRGVLDEASGKWGIRVTRVEIKAIDPPKSVKDAMEKQMRAEREKRATILTAEGFRQSQILTAEGEKQSAILRAEGDRQAAILRAQGQAEAITEVFSSIHRNDPDPKLLAYQYLQTLPQIAAGPGNSFWVIPGEVTTALKAVTAAFTGPSQDDAAPGRAAANTAGPVAGQHAQDGQDALAGEAASAVSASQTAAAALAAGITAAVEIPAQPTPDQAVATQPDPAHEIPEIPATTPPSANGSGGQTGSQSG